MKSNLTEVEIDQCYVFAKSSRDVDGLQQVAITLAHECLRLRRLNDLNKRELSSAIAQDGGADL